MARIAYSTALAERICAEIAKGKALVTICDTEPWAPGASAAFSWLAMYAHARDVQQEFYAAQVISIADTEKDPAIARNRMDARKWYASKVAPKKWGDKVDISATVEVTGASTEHLAAFLAMIETKNADS